MPETVRSRWKDAGMVAAGLVAGGLTWYLVEGVVPPAVVAFVTFVALLAVDRYDL